MIKIANYDSIDLDWTWDGDYMKGQDGDLKDTKYDLLQSFKNELRTIMRSEFGDWQENPNVGTNMSEYRGAPNTREVAKDMQNRITTRLAAATIVRTEDLKIRIIPVGASQVLVVVMVNAAATPGNNLTPGDPLVITLLYDSLEDSVFFLEESKASRDYLGA